jgi:pimeloyl-ACP methyl ester carboxylesterase
MRRPRLFIPFAVLLVLVVALVELRDAGAPPTPVHNAFGHGPTIVLVHGLGSRPEHWLPVARLLARDHRVVLVGLPGHGESPMPEPFSLARAAQSLENALDAESKEPVVLVGHSVGGLVAATVAFEHPGRVRELVLVETMLRPQVTVRERDEILRGLETDYQGVLRRAFLSFGRDSVQGVELYRTAAAEDSANMKRWIRLALSSDFSQRAAGLAMPVLAVMAPHTWPLNESWAESARETGYDRVPEVHPARIENCGHFVMLDQPRELARLIERFASRTETAPVALR